MSTEETSLGIDWDAIKQRLDELKDITSESGRVPAEESRARMDQRARALARPSSAEPDTSEILEVTRFQLGEEQFAIETRFVREVFRPSAITPVPDTPAVVVGVTNLRGEVLAVMDLRELFDMDAFDQVERPPLLVLGGGRAEMGLVTDGVRDVRRLRMQELLEPPGTIAAADNKHLLGVTEEALLVLNGDALLADERLYIDEGDPLRHAFNERSSV